MDIFYNDFNEPLDLFEAAEMYPELMKPHIKKISKQIVIDSFKILNKNLEEGKFIKDIGDKDVELVNKLNVMFINNIEQEKISDYKGLRRMRRKALKLKKNILQGENIQLNPHEFRILENKKEQLLDSFLIQSLREKKYKNITYESIKDFINLFDTSFLLTNEMFVLNFLILAGIAFPIAFIISFIAIIAIYEKNK
jgi:hypothetical protein